MESSTGRYFNSLPQAGELHLIGTGKADGFASAYFDSKTRVFSGTLNIFGITRPAA